MFDLKNFLNTLPAGRCNDFVSIQRNKEKTVRSNCLSGRFPSPSWHQGVVLSPLAAADEMRVMGIESMTAHNVSAEANHSDVAASVGWDTIPHIIYLE